MVIALSYKKQSGKDSFYNISKSAFPHLNIHRIAFADELKNEIDELYFKPMGLNQYEFTPAQKEIVRPIYQGHGSVRRELFYKDYWVDKAFEKIENAEDIYMITDCRYLNELEYVKKHNGICVHIKRPSISIDDTHSSEMELNDYWHLFDYTIDNNGTLEEYRDKVVNLMNKILEHHS